MSIKEFYLQRRVIVPTIVILVWAAGGISGMVQGWQRLNTVDNAELVNYVAATLTYGFPTVAGSALALALLYPLRGNRKVWGQEKRELAIAGLLAGAVSLIILFFAGRVVGHIVDASAAPGTHQWAWVGLWLFYSLLQAVAGGLMGSVVVAYLFRLRLLDPCDDPA